MSYFELAQQLLREYFAPAPVTVVFSGEKHQQWTAGDYTVLVTETSATSTLINVLADSNATAVPINWDEWDLAEIKRTDELQRRFDQYLNLKLISIKVLPKRGSNKEPEEKSLQPVADQRAPPQPLREYPSEEKRPPDMPEFDDEYEINDRSRSGGVSGVSVGERDLYPAGVGRYPTMQPYLDPLAGGRGGGMYVGPQDPMFGQQSGNTSRRGVPPGARFDDPYGEDNLHDMGMGLPGNLRDPGGFGPGSGSGGFGGGSGSGFGSGGFGGSGFGGF